MKGRKSAIFDQIRGFANSRMRGQSAVEYLTTYGWAILALIIVLGALLSSGVLTPTYFISEECYLGPNLPCHFQIYDDGGIVLKLNITNGFSYPIQITEIKLYTQEEYDAGGLVSTEKIDSGDSKIETIALIYPPTQNTIKKYRVELTYVSCAPELAKPGDAIGSCTDQGHMVGGRIIGSVLQKTS